MKKAVANVVQAVKKYKDYIITAVVVAASVATGFAAFWTLGAYGVLGASAAIISGAAAGFVGAVVSTKLHGGSWRDALKSGAKGALIGGISAGVAFGIGEIGASMLESGYSSLAVAASKAVLHGVSRAAIAKAQGQKVSSAFWSGFASSVISPFRRSVAGNNYGYNVAFSAVAGGTVSEISGGKFANGAVTGAFVFMFNHSLHEAQEDVEELRLKGIKASVANHTGKENGYYAESDKGFIHTGNHYEINGVDKLAMAALSLVPAVRIGKAAYYFGMMNPAAIEVGATATDIVIGGLSPEPPTTPIQVIGFTLKKGVEAIYE